MGKLAIWYARRPVSFRRAMLVAGAAFMVAVAGLIIYRLKFASFVPAMTMLMLARLFVTRAFAASRLKGLAAAGKSLGIRLDEAGTLDGRLRGIAVRVVPTGSRQLKAFVSDGLGKTELETDIGDPFRPTTENKIVSAVELLVAKAEAAQTEICLRARNGADSRVRRDAVRSLRAIAREERISLVDETIALAAKDAESHVRLAATFDGTPDVNEAEALLVLASGDEAGVTEAAGALATIGSANALPDLVAMRNRAPDAVERAITAIRARTGVQAGGLAVAAPLDTDGAVSLTANAGALTVKSSS